LHEDIMRAALFTLSVGLATLNACSAAPKDATTQAGAAETQGDAGSDAGGSSSDPGAPAVMGAWDQQPGSPFFEIFQVSLNPDGSYTSNIAQGLTLSAQPCRLTPCLVAEEGTFTVARADSGWTLTLVPSERPSVFNPDAVSREPQRVYSIREASQQTLSLARGEGVAVLRGMGHAPACAFVTCAEGTHCVDDASGVSCQPD
jgi:hypothetical protein